MFRTKYVENVTYCDTQRFSYDEKGNIALNFGSEKEEANTVLVWCMISSFAQMSALCRVNGKFDSNNYKNILWQYPVHRRKSVNEFLAEHKRNIFVVDLPKSFGDIMPLEQLWLEMSIKFTEENEIPVKLQQVVTNGGSQSQVAHRAVTDSCNRSVSHTCETDPYQACYISVLQEICLELLCFTGFGMLQACVFYVKHTSVIICYGFVAQPSDVRIMAEHPLDIYVLNG
ncbi:hypothetical protein OUZ56_029863 [Daphnia magna]|uniref:Uncharacterized protein n=1 Tax=Daphnia magna TaxID=35525 RepID=A0ABR0B823_9CRUS|nr:hypothetical protein OUZ56_029863 [Daphnia magna]